MARYKTTRTSKQTKKGFPIWLVITGAGLVLLSVLTLILGNGRNRYEPEITGAPAIKVDQEYINYADVKLGGSPIRTVVRVTNVGDQQLKFTEAPYVEVLEGC